MRRRPVKRIARAGMHNQVRRATRRNGARAVERPGRIANTQPHLGRYRNHRRHGLPHSRHDTPDPRRIVQQGRARAVPVDLRHRTTEIEVDARRRQARKLRRIVRQIVGIAAEQLHIDRHAGRRPPAVIEFRADAPETAQRHLRPGNAHELAHRRIVAAHLRQHIAQQPVGQAFHRRKNNAGGHGAQKREKNSGIGTGLDTEIDTARTSA